LGFLKEHFFSSGIDVEKTYMGQINP
jgi:hypothetical protein